MIALLKIHCPHCGTAGQILMPPPGKIIIGPCPECENLVAIFAGDALPLDSAIMNRGAMKEKYEHVMQVLTAYLEGRVRECFSHSQKTAHAHDVHNKQRAEKGREDKKKSISDEEFQEFISHELLELDDPEFFRRLS